MGLTFHYEFRLPASVQAVEVDDLLQRLKLRAKQLGFVAFSEDFEGVVDIPNDGWRHFFNVCADVNASTTDDDERQYSGNLSTARGFLAYPGQGTEVTPFAFMLREFDDDGSREWHWMGHCKTQYASVHGEQHFLDCHLRLVDMMEHAIQLGIDVTVYDEGQYWETRDRALLLRELDTMNRLCARVAGSFHDALGPEKIEASIFEHPEFEHLEGG
jgi:hypothetical protein